MIIVMDSNSGKNKQQQQQLHVEIIIFLLNLRNYYRGAGQIYFETFLYLGFHKVYRRLLLIIVSHVSFYHDFWLKNNYDQQQSLVFEL